MHFIAALKAAVDVFLIGILEVTAHPIVQLLQ